MNDQNYTYQVVLLAQIHICQIILRMVTDGEFNTEDRLDMIKEVCEKHINKNAHKVKPVETLN